MWQIGFSREASQYAIDSHPDNEDVLIAIETLAFKPDGLPEEGVSELEPIMASCWSFRDLPADSKYT